jgi:phosphoglycolate phosphatase
LKIVLFDLDGTITDSSEGIVNSIKYALSRLGFPEEPTEKIKQFIGPPLQQTFKINYGISDYQNAVTIYREYYAEKGIYENRLYDGIVAVLDQLKNEGYTIGLATGKPTYYSHIILKHFKIDHYFNAVVGSNMNGTRGEKPEIIRDVLAELNYDKELHEVVMIGDRKHDVHGAHHHQIKCIGVTYGYAEGDELIKAGAAHIVHHPSELLALL